MTISKCIDINIYLSIEFIDDICWMDVKLYTTTWYFVYAKYVKLWHSERLYGGRNCASVSVGNAWEIFSSEERQTSLATQILSLSDFCQRRYRMALTIEVSLSLSYTNEQHFGVIGDLVLMCHTEHIIAHSESILSPLYLLQNIVKTFCNWFKSAPDDNIF